MLLAPAALLALFLPVSGPPQAGVFAGGAIVEAAPSWGAGARGGLRAGDRVTGWRRAQRRGAVSTPFDLRAAEAEEAPRGHVVLTVQRPGGRTTVTLPPGDWALDLRPVLAEDALARYAEAQAHARAGRARETRTMLEPLAAALQQSGRALDATWLWLEAAKALARSRQADAARAALAQARTLATGSAAAWVAWVEAEALGSVGDRTGATAAWDRARTDLERRSPGSLTLATLLAAEGGYHRRYTLDIERAESVLRRALAIQRLLAPGSYSEAWSRYSIAAVRLRRGDIAGAAREARISLAQQQALHPALPEVQATLDLLGLVATEHGELDRAEALYRQAADLCSRYFPGGREEVLVLNHLGVVYRRRGETDAAQGAYERALAIAEKVMPEGPEVAGTLNNLGLVAEQRQDWAGGETFHRRALAIREKLSPGSLDVASSLGNLGVDALRRGDFATAERYLVQALDLKQAKVAGSESHGNSLFWLGELRRAQKNWPEARRLFEEAAAMRRRVAPASGDLAEAYQRLGAIAVAEGHPDEAARQLLAAADVLDLQRGRLGATADGTGFAARVAPIYREAVDVLATLDRKAEAFAMLERSRARGLLAQIAERELTLPGLPRALEERRQASEAEYDRLLEQMGRLSFGKDDARIAELTRDLSAAREKRAVIAAEVRRVRPGVAALRYPEPLDLDHVRGALDPGTVLLSYSVGEARTLLFVVTARDTAGDGLSVFSVPLGADALKDRVAGLRGFVEDGRRGQSATAFEAQARSLYDALVGPAEKLLVPSARVLICADGPLRALPFAALKRGDTPAFLGEWKPLHHAVSATLYAEMRRTALACAPHAGPMLVAFGDPAYGTVAPVTGGARAALSSRGLAALPYTRREVQAITTLFAGKSVAFLGAEASERRARALGRGPRILHFATHALLDRRFPLDSALALAAPVRSGTPNEASDNGLLQAWEIMEKLRLDADLVTLSACETGLGRDAAGEGIVGLTRAFQFAGARSVLASLWPVSEGGTARLMESFYRELSRGRAKDEALRLAEKEAIRAGRPPFEWAAFQLSGEWK